MKKSGTTFGLDVLVKTIVVVFTITFFMIIFFPDGNNRLGIGFSEILVASQDKPRIKDNGSASAYEELKDRYYNSLKEEDKNTSSDLASRLSQNITNQLYKAISIDYLSAVSNGSEMYKVPKWALIGYNAINMNGLMIKNPPIPNTVIDLKVYGTDNDYNNSDNKTTGENKPSQYTQVESQKPEQNKIEHKLPEVSDSDTSLMASIIRQQRLKSNQLNSVEKPVAKMKLESKDYLTFYNIGTTEVINKVSNLNKNSIIGIPDSIYEKYGSDGNSDGRVDKYNLYDAMTTLGNYINVNKNKISEQIKLNSNYSSKRDIYRNRDLWLLCFLRNDMESNYNSWIEYIGSKDYCLGSKLSELDIDKIYKYYMEGDINNVEATIYKYLITNGWKLNKMAVSELVDKGIVLDVDGTTTTDKFDINTPLFVYDGIENLSIPTGKFISTLEMYVIGNSIQKELNYRLINSGNTGQPLNELLHDSIKSYRDTLKEIETINSFTVPLDFNKVKYYWQTNNPVSDMIQRRKTEGQYGEVGYKGSFPIFIQQTGFNRVSNVKWRFNGGDTTIGKAGCSLLSATSLIHAAGYDKYNIPGTNYKPTVENMARVFSNGPIIGNYISSQGYNVKFRATRTKQDLDILFQDLKAGIPYVINTKAGKITGYKKDGTPVNTEFTYGGHFIVMVSAFEDNGRRYVEVVQSTRGNAGTKDFDQNQMVFDFDELIKKNILRSSQGYAVPAYTITGASGLPTPKYLLANYKTPYTTSESKNVEVAQNNITSDEVVLRRNQISKSGDSLKKVQGILKQLGVDASQVTTKNNKAKSGIQVINTEDDLLGVYEENSDRTQNLLIFVDYNNAIQITHLIKTPNKSGKMGVNSMIGETTNTTRVNFVIRVSGDDWMILRSSDINVTED